MKKKQTEIITKEMLQKGFETGVVTIEDYYNGCIALCCKIGEYAFYFIGSEDENLSTEEYWKSYTMEMTINMLYDILKTKDTALDNGIYKDEYNYYVAVLKEIQN